MPFGLDIARVQPGQRALLSAWPVDDQERSDNPWLKSLHAWADSHLPLGQGHLVDDSREGIYSGTVDDPR